MDFMPATELFVEDACAVDVAGVGIPEDITPMSGVILEITSQTALDELQEKLGEHYRIIVREDGDYMFPATVDAALALIAEARQKETQGFRWVLLRCLKVIRLGRSAASVLPLLQGMKALTGAQHGAANAPFLKIFRP